MTSQAPPPSGRRSPPPPPPPPKERRPTLQTSPALANSAITKSPVRRKPLPPTAFSPTTPAKKEQPNGSPQIFGQIIEHLGGRAQSNTNIHQTTRPRPEISSSPPIGRQTSKDNIVSSPEKLPSLINTIPAGQNTVVHSSNTSLSEPAAEDHSNIVASYEQSNPPSDASRQDTVKGEEMALTPGFRPPPLRSDSASSARSQPVVDTKKPQTPGAKFTSFFTRKQTSSPDSESAYSSSDRGKSPIPSPFPNAENVSANIAADYGFPPAPDSQHSQSSIEFDPGVYAQSDSTMDRATQLEAELREISKELAGSIKREMDLEDMVERLQAEAPLNTMASDRTSDYFSDSGTSSIRPPTSEYNPKEEVERIKREADQQRASLKVEFSQKWQRELATRKAMESHLNYMEQKYSQERQHASSSSDASAKVKELDTALEDARRKLNEERQTKTNFEDLLTALRDDLERHRNERDNLRDEVVPQLKSRIEGLETTLAEAQKSPYDVARMQHELQSLRDENAALHSARMMNAQFGSIAEEDGTQSQSQGSFFGRIGGLQRTNTLGKSNSRMNRSNSLSRSNSVSKGFLNDLPQNVADQFKAIEQQRDALHTTVKYLLRRQTVQNRHYEKRLKVADIEKTKSERTESLSALTGVRKGGYEREVRTLRAEINLLRKRADDALEQKWQCEKGLAGLKMDLDRSKQETESLQRLLKASDSSDPEVLSSTLQNALKQLQQQSSQARSKDTIGSLENEQQLAKQLEESAERSESLASQVRKQLSTNSTLRTRLKAAIEKGERDQTASAAQINDLQGKLRKLEDTITSAQTQSETAVMKHEEEVRVLRASHNAQLLRAKTPNAGLLSPTPRSPLSPMFTNSSRTPRLDRTSSGPGMPLHQALKTEHLERKVEELEKALADAEKEMGEVVGRMNTAQIGVADLEGERDEALKQTRKLEAEIAAEREKVRMLFGGMNLPTR